MANAEKLVKTGKYNAALFGVAEDKKRENGPVLTGLINIDEKTTTELAAWVKESKEGGKYYSLQVGNKGKEGNGTVVYGAMFPETKKKSDKAPDYTGAVNLTENGRELRVAGWKRTSKDGKAYISLVVEAPQQREPQAPAQEAAPAASSIDADIPF